MSLLGLVPVSITFLSGTLLFILASRLKRRTHNPSPLLISYRADYLIGTLYTRSSGKRRFVEVELGFDGEKSVEHVHVLSRHMEQALAAELPDLHFRIVPVWEPDDE